MSIPSLIPSTIVGGGSVTFTVTGPAYDLAIAGIPFCVAISEQTPYVRESSPAQKQQFDTGARAGERSLADWWRRSQASFHGGAGLLYAEPDGPEDPIADIRFWRSKNADVWTPGEVTPLPDTTQFITVGSAMSGLATGLVGSTNYTLVTFTNTLRVHNGASTSDYTWGGSGTILSLAVDGKNYYVADNTGIYSGPIDGTSSGAKIWDNAASRVKLAWVKQRLMCAQNNKVYELVGTGPTLPTEKYSHPNTAWIWTDFADGPASILASGYSGIESAIHDFVLETDGAAPTLVAGQATPVPTGEVVHSIYGYVGSVLGIGTSRGLRIGQFDDNGTLRLGPLTFESATPIKCLTGRDRFLYATATSFVDSETCLVRIDLGQPTDRTGKFAYAADIQAPTAQSGTASWVAVGADARLVFSIDSYGVVKEGVGPGSTRPAWIETSRIRMATVEPKLYRRLWVRGAFASPGTVAVTATSSDGQVTVVLPAISSAGDLDETAVVPSPQEWVSLKFEMTGSASLEFRGFVLKALPATPRRRLYQIPLRVNDFELDKRNNKFGYPGYAAARILQLEDIEDGQDEVRLELFTPQGTLARQCTIEQISYRQVHQPGQTGAIGGVMVVTLKTVT